MKPRDKAGDEIVRKTEGSLPRWKGPSLEGWMSLEGQARQSMHIIVVKLIAYLRTMLQAARDPYKVYADIISRLKAVKDKGACV